MNKFRFFILVVILCAIYAVFAVFLDSVLPQKKVYPIELTCEYLVNPLGIDVVQPRLSWKIEQTVKAPKNQLQTAYQILVASSPEKLKDNCGDVWDSGKVPSNQSVQVVYNGSHLKSMQRYWWKVRIWNNHCRFSEWSEPAYWGTGIMQSSEWQARWIGDQPDIALRNYISYVQNNYKNKDFDRHYWENPPYTPSPLLRKSFAVKRQPKHAYLYASALGYYEMWLNGNRIGNRLQAPEWTNYFTRVQYQTFDLSGQLEQGENVLAATLADGWCIGRLGGIRWRRSFPHRGFYAPDRRLIAQLVIEYDDGSREMIISDDSWKINTDGYIRRADNFTGQTIDAQKIISGWNRPGFDDSSWNDVYEDNTVSRNLVSQKNEPIRVHQELKPVEIKRWNGKYMVNFGQNIAGHCALKIKGQKGTVITVRHGEWLKEDGSLYTESLGYATAVDTFVLSGYNDYFDPSFTYHGFQYAEVSGADTLTADMISAKAVSSDPKLAGSFECSNPKLNRLYKNVVWTQRNNMYSILHDNPSRDERTGATGDVLIFCQSSMFNMEMAAFYAKLSDELNENAYNGQFYSMIPSLYYKNFWNGWVGAPGWAEAGLVVPWRMYQNYADTRVLQELYAAMKKHVDATERENPGLIWKIRHNNNNDWLNANTIANPPDSDYSTKRGGIHNDVFATAFFAYATQMLSDVAGTLGYAADAEHYGELARRIRARFVASFVRDDGYIEGNTQGTYALALHFKLLPENLRDKAFSYLLECIEEYDYRISTGFVTTPMLMQELVNYGRSDIAYRLLESERFPSWIFMINSGATTVWERWDAVVQGRGINLSDMNSLDHVAFGAVSEWMFRHILGINPDEKYPGYEHFTIHPRPGGSLTWAKGSYNSIKGEIVSDWKIENDIFTLKVKIPANTTATIVLPVKGAIEKGSGEYTFVEKITDKDI
jgi:alpha-L-rhamnosidase